MDKILLNKSVETSIKKEIEEHIEVSNLLKEKICDIKSISKTIICALADKKKVLTCGNGGSASDSSHFASEIVGRYQKDRKGYPSINLASETSAITAIGNDYGFENIFSRQVEAFGNQGDILVVISTSGNSINLVNAAISAKNKGLKVVGLLGRNGGKLLGLVDENVTIKSNRTCRIQEMHSIIIHIICDLFDEIDLKN
ncbi:MAG: SIS domain-containing protein [Prochlorococcus marinus CUG1437]|nr:SIS domain-containing protein [Prochlorococcus marinus CUG1437]